MLNLILCPLRPSEKMKMLTLFINIIKHALKNNNQHSDLLGCFLLLYVLQCLRPLLSPRARYWKTYIKEACCQGGYVGYFVHTSRYLRTTSKTVGRIRLPLEGCIFNYYNVSCKPCYLWANQYWLKVQKLHTIQ